MWMKDVSTQMQSLSGISQQHEVEAFFLPLWMFINDKEYYEAEYPHVEATQI